MRRWMAIAVLLAVGMIRPVMAQEQKVVLVGPIEETANDFTGWVTFSGRARNNGLYALLYPQAVLTLKKSGRVVEVHSDYLDTPSENTLKPGEEGTFSMLTLNVPSDYDTLSIRFVGRQDALDPALVKGNVRLIENTLTLKESLGDASMLGEFINETNAVIGEVDIRFTLLDADGKFLGTTRLYTSEIPEEIYPGEIISFRAFSDVVYDQVAGWDYGVTFIPLRLADDIPTAIERRSWGEVKVQGVFVP